MEDDGVVRSACSANEVELRPVRNTVSAMNDRLSSISFEQVAAVTCAVSYA